VGWRYSIYNRSGSDLEFICTNRQGIKNVHILYAGETVRGLDYRIILKIQPWIDSGHLELKYLYEPEPEPELEPKTDWQKEGF
jgi:hypothetical protein